MPRGKESSTAATRKEVMPREKRREITREASVLSQSYNADDAICERVVVPEGEREGTQGYQLRLETAPVLLCRFLIADIEP